MRASCSSARAPTATSCRAARGPWTSSSPSIGRAAHAGVEPEKGRSAILEAARIVTELHALNGRWPGVTVNVGVIGGGTRPNVVAERCALEVDVRAVTRDSLVEAEAAIRAITQPRVVPDVTVEIEETGRHWPMEKLERSGRLVDHAVALAADLGFPLRDAATGGASDANTTAGMGVPTIDGLGPIGGPGPFARRVPRGRLDRAADRTAGRADRDHRTGPRGPRLAVRRVAARPTPDRRRWPWRPRRRRGPRTVTRRHVSSGGPWRGAPATRAPSPSAITARSRAPRTRVRMASRSTRATRTARPGPHSRSSRARSPRPASRWTTWSGRGCTSRIPTMPRRGRGPRRGLQARPPGRDSRGGGRPHPPEPSGGGRGDGAPRLSRRIDGFVSRWSRSAPGRAAARARPDRCSRGGRKVDLAGRSRRQRG